MKSFLLSLPLLFLGIPAFSTTWTITNLDFTFNPATITINQGDNVNFNLGIIHNAVEVSLSTWNANGNTALAGGFEVPFGGGSVQSSQLAIGTHYYVCAPHASSGMKGMIIVQSITDIADNKLQSGFSVYPNPSINIITVRASDKMTGRQYYMTNLIGNLVLNGRIINETEQVDISQLPKGIYLIRVDGIRGEPVKVIKN